MSEAKEPISLRAYARHRGVSLRAVQKAIQSGRIKTGEDGRIDAAVADSDWTKNTGLRMQVRTRKPAATSSHDAIRRSTGSVTPEQLEAVPRLESGTEYTRARAVRETYQARITKIEYEERSGRVVSRDEVQVATFNKFRTFRDGMLNIPDRVAAMLAAETDPAKVHQLLSTEIRKALQEFSDGNR